MRNAVSWIIHKQQKIYVEFFSFFLLLSAEGLSFPNCMGLVSDLSSPWGLPCGGLWRNGGIGYINGRERAVSTEHHGRKWLGVLGVMALPQYFHCLSWLSGLLKNDPFYNQLTVETDNYVTWYTEDFKRFFWKRILMLTMFDLALLNVSVGLVV